MRHLYLLRHAKSGWGDERLDDHDRPLATRGERACDVIGPVLARSRPLPAVVLCSSARRAVDTAARVLPHLSPNPPLRIDRKLYLASPAELLDALNDLEDAFDAVLLVGHNPGLQLLSLQLIGSGDPDACQELARKLPTAALLQLRFGAAHWAEIGPGSAELLHFVRPRELGAS